MAAEHVLLAPRARASADVNERRVECAVCGLRLRLVRTSRGWPDAADVRGACPGPKGRAAIRDWSRVAQVVHVDGELTMLDPPVDVPDPPPEDTLPSRPAPLRRSWRPSSSPDAPVVAVLAVIAFMLGLFTWAVFHAVR